MGKRGVCCVWSLWGQVLFCCCTAFCSGLLWSDQQIMNTIPILFYLSIFSKIKNRKTTNDAKYPCIFRCIATKNLLKQIQVIEFSSKTTNLLLEMWIYIFFFFKKTCSQFWSCNPQLYSMCPHDSKEIFIQPNSISRLNSRKCRMSVKYSKRPFFCFPNSTRNNFLDSHEMHESFPRRLSTKSSPKDCKIDSKFSFSSSHGLNHRQFNLPLVAHPQ